MSFFGFSQPADPFAGLSRHDVDENDALDFEDTYDGLGDQLDEADDIHNADTFGGGPAVAAGEFDFSGQTALMADTMDDEQVLYEVRNQSKKAAGPPKQFSKPAKTGYEKYGKPGAIPNLEVNADIWGLQPKRDTQSFQPPQQSQQLPSISTATRKMMSLEEVEAAMRNQGKKPVSLPTGLAETSFDAQLPQYNQFAQQQQQQQPHVNAHQFQQQPSANIPQILQRPQQQGLAVEQAHNTSASPPQQQQQAHVPFVQTPQILQHPGANQPQGYMQQQSFRQGPPPPMHTHPRHAHQHSRGGPSPQPPMAAINPQLAAAAALHSRGPSLGNAPFGSTLIRPEQLLHLSEEERAAILLEDAKRAKRNRKIHLLSRDNGLMTPQDKNFITRIQLQQLMTATGNVDEQGPEAMLAEDFYFQVFSQIRGAPRQHPNQPLNHFAQTYLHQTGGRTANRRYPRGGDSHMRRMEQQVQRAVEVAKLRPKNRQLVIEGSLGKISFSNAKTPKPLLNIKRQEGADSVRPQSGAKPPKALDSKAGQKAVLRDIENLYLSLMKVEDHKRRVPPQPKEESSADEFQALMDWRSALHELTEELWTQLKVLEPIDPSLSTPHPFIAILSHVKGKKLMSRVLPQIDEQQRLTVLTMIVVHLDQLDVVRMAASMPGEDRLPRAVREDVDLFMQAVIPGLFGYVDVAQLGIIIGLLGLIVERVDVQAIVRTRIGLEFLTMFLSRAELLKSGGHADAADLEQWSTLYDRLFDLLEPYLPIIFTRPVTSGEDTFVWQFLATIGVGASPEQQQRLVIAVKERVMESVTHAKTLPEDLARPRLDSVNLFMVSIGLDVELLG